MGEGVEVVYRCFVEIKLSQERYFKISKKDLAARRSFAENYGLPLIFAIKFKPFEKSGLWIVIDAKELELKGRKVSVEDLVDSHTAILFDDYAVLTHPDLHIINYYDKNATEEGITHREHGRLIGTYLVLPDTNPIEISKQDETLINAALESFDFKHVSADTSGSVTAVLSSIGGQMRFLSNMVYDLNNLSKNEDNTNTYDSTRIIASIDSETNPPTLFNRNHIEIAFSIINSHGNIFFFASIGDHEKNYRRLVRLGKK